MATKIEIQFKTADPDQKEYIADIRSEAMKESLINSGRFDEVRVRERLLRDFDHSKITVMWLNDNVVGFYDLRKSERGFELKHLYIRPQYQSLGIGELAIDSIKNKANGYRIFLNALKLSKVNHFYRRMGFTLASEDELDYYYYFST